MKAKIWIWIVIGIVLIIFGFLFFQGSPEPNASYDIAAPNTIAITQGTEGSINGLEIGVTFVDNVSAGLSIYDADGAASTSQQAILEIGETVIVGSQQIELLDLLSSSDTAVLQISASQ